MAFEFAQEGEERWGKSYGDICECFGFENENDQLEIVFNFEVDYICYVYFYSELRKIHFRTPFGDIEIFADGRLYNSHPVPEYFRHFLENVFDAPYELFYRDKVSDQPKEESFEDWIREFKEGNYDFLQRED